MANEAPVVHIGENSPEQIAYKLFRDIAAVEGRDLFANGNHPVDREWILRTFCQCMLTVRAHANINSVVESFNPGRQR